MARPKKNEFTKADRSKVFAYINEWQKGKYDRFNIVRLKGEKDLLVEIAKKKGMSMNEFINYCIDKELKRMKIDLEQMKTEASAKESAEEADPSV